MSKKGMSTGPKAPMPESTPGAKPTGKPLKSGDKPGVPVASKAGGSGKSSAGKGGVSQKGGATHGKPTSHGGKPGAGKGGL